MRTSLAISTLLLVAIAPGVDFGTHAAGGPFVLTVTGPQNTVQLSEVLVGDVYLCSGQSNMELPLVETENGSGWTLPRSKGSIYSLSRTRKPSPMCHWSFWERRASWLSNSTATSAEVSLPRSSAP